MGDEQADIVNYVVRLADVLNIDLEKAVLNKVRRTQASTLQRGQTLLGAIRRRRHGQGNPAPASGTEPRPAVQDRALPSSQTDGFDSGPTPGWGAGLRCDSSNESKWSVNPFDLKSLRGSVRRILAPAHYQTGHRHTPNKEARGIPEYPWSFEDPNGSF